MSPRGRRATRLLSLAGGLLATTLAAAPRQPTLRLETPRWSFSRASLSLTVEQAGPLAGRKLAVFVFVDDNLVERLATQGGRTEARVGGLELAVGSHRLKVKAGTEEAETEFRVLSPVLPLAALGLLAGLAWALSAWRARQRAPGRAP